MVTTETGERRHVYHIFSVFHAERDRLQAHLTEAGIQSGMHYPCPVHLQKAYANLGHKPGDFPVSERIANTQLSLPMYPDLTDVDLARVVAALKAFS